MEPRIVISYRYRRGLIKDTETFSSELRKHYQIHEKPKWLPAAEGNFEMWFDFFINTPVLKFIGEAIVAGVAYDLAKHIIFKPFWDSLKKLSDSNSGQLEILSYRFNFDDITICVYGVARNYFAIFSAIFNEISKQIPYLKTQEKVKDLYEILIPVEQDGHINQWEGSSRPEDYLERWRLSTEYGLFTYMYFLKEKTIVEL